MERWIERGVREGGVRIRRERERDIVRERASEIEREEGERERHPDPDRLVNCARFGKIEPLVLGVFWGRFLVL